MPLVIYPIFILKVRLSTPVARALLYLFLFFQAATNSFAQKLPFQNYGVEKGLIQSQVQCFTQDNQRHIWVGTYGGLDRFDGSTFKHFSKADGLNSNGITSLYSARNGYIWAGTFKGISCYNGYSFTNYAIENKPGSFSFSAITEDDNGAIWAFGFNKGLFVLKNNQFSKAALPVANAIPTALFRNTQGQLIVNFHKLGIYTYANNAWRKTADADFLTEGEFIVGLTAASGSYYALTNKKMLVSFSGNNTLGRQQVKADNFGALCSDNKGNIWIGTNKGILVYKSYDLSKFQTYNAASGLSDNFIADIYRDAEDNMWIGTDGDGVFKFSGGRFSRFDNSNGLPGNIVMGIVNGESKQLYLGTREGGLVRYNPDDGKLTTLDYSPLSKTGINCMAADNKGNILIGTLDDALLKYNGSSFKKIKIKQPHPLLINSIIPDKDKTWLATSSGCYYLAGDSLVRIRGIDEITLSVLPAGNGEILIGSINGLYTLSATDSAKRITDPLLQNAEINCLAPYHKYILIGTAGDGLYCLERITGKIYKCDAKSGLSDNQVFSIYVDSKNKIWAGSGTGVQQVQFDETKKTFTVRKFSKADGYENSENNLNTITEDSSGNVWIGTTKGVFIYSPAVSPVNPVKPYIVIQQVATSQKKADTADAKNISPWYNYPLSPVLPYNSNAISFTIKGVYMKDPESISYSYQLAGYDTGFSQPVQQSFFNYQSLEPGNYVFRVKAITADGLESGNIAEFPFTIATPFHKSKWFLLLLILSLILTGIFIQLLINKAKRRKETQLERLRQEEQEKIKQRTSEDFHDELGNKLTRISLLADILQKKVEPGDTEKAGLISQIKDNVQSLYTGTKDVIWSLSPGSDNLLEILQRIEQFGAGLFHDSAIDFSMEGLTEIDPETKLPIDYSRNIIMIFKELLNNCLRHAKATKVLISVQPADNDQLLIIQQDNGMGYNQNTVKKGNGLNNIQRRAERIGAELEIVSEENRGTTTRLKIIPPNGG